MKDEYNNHSNYENCQKKYWVIYDNTENLENTEKFGVEKKRWDEYLNESKSGEPEWIFYAPQKFGDYSQENGKRIHSPVEMQLLKEQPKDDPSQEAKRKEWTQKTIVFLRMDRLTDSGIGRRDDRSLDWCLRGILTEFTENLNMRNLRDSCYAIVVSCGVDYAFLIYKEEGNKQQKVTVFFRPLRTCRYYMDDLGFIRGKANLMIASCLRSVIDFERDGKNKSFIDSLKNGIKDGLWRQLLQYHAGYPVHFKEYEQQSYFEYYRALYDVPSPEEVESEKDLDYRVSSCTIDIPPLESGRAGINLLKEDICKKPKELIDNFLHGIVEKGLERYSQESGIIKFPVARFGYITAVDHEEIENFRNLQILIRKYLAEDWEKPLGIAVFGQPGSGKSSGIREIAKTLYSQSKTV